MLLRVVTDPRALNDPAVLLASPQIDSPIGDACRDFFEMMADPSAANDCLRSPFVDLVLAYTPDASDSQRRRAMAQVLGDFLRPPEIVLSNLRSDAYGWHQPSPCREIRNCIFLNLELHFAYLDILKRPIFAALRQQFAFADLLFAKTLHAMAHWTVFVVASLCMLFEC
jgi:hypothetical protein